MPSPNQEPSKWAIILTLWTGGDWFAFKNRRVSKVGKSTRNDKLPEVRFRPVVAELKRLGAMEERGRGGESEEYRSKLRLAGVYKDNAPGSLRCKIGLAYFSDGQPHSGKDIEAEIGYDDSPRLKQDILDAGYEVLRTTDAANRSRAMYQMRHQRQVRPARQRVQNLAAVAEALVQAGVDRKCARCGRVEKLQPDHRIPIIVAQEHTDEAEEDPGAAFQFLCNSCNTMKREDCKRCPNMESLAPEMCKACYWFDPKNAQSRVVSLGTELDGQLNAYALRRGVLPEKVIQEAIKRYLEP